MPKRLNGHSAAGPAPEPRPRPSWRPLVLMAVLVIVADQISKHLVRTHIPVDSALTVIPGCFDLVHGRNTGMAFGLFQETPGVLTLLGVLTIPLLVWGYMSLPFTWAGRIAWAAIVGGAGGNLIDRLRLGYVTDFVDWYIGRHHWYTFNIADACITVSVLAIVGLNLVDGRSRADTSADASDSV